MTYWAGVAAGHTESIHSGGLKAGTEADSVNVHIPYTANQHQKKHEVERVSLACRCKRKNGCKNKICIIIHVALEARAKVKTQLQKGDKAVDNQVPVHKTRHVFTVSLGLAVLVVKMRPLNITVLKRQGTEQH